jgi:hypothetical protein
MNPMRCDDGQNCANTSARRNGEKGQSILIVAAGLVVLMLAAGLAIDMGYLRYEKRRAQMAADSAAIAGAAAYEACAQGGQCTDMVTAGQTSAAYNGFDVSNPQVSVAIQNPPTTGAYVGNANYVEAIVTQNTPVYFMRILGPSTTSYTISASAVAYPGPGVGCIYALNSLSLGGFNTKALTTCLVADTGNLNIPDSSYLFDTGGLVYGGTPTVDSTHVNPAPVQGAPAGNPLPYLSTLPQPSEGNGACNINTFVCTPGTYATGLPLTGTAAWTLQPGVYEVGGGGLSISGSGSVTGSGVTFYINSGAVSINGADQYDYANCSTMPNPTFGSTVQLTAPASGTYAGILFIQQPGNQAPGTITLNNGDTCNQVPTTLATSSYMWGVMYFPSAQLTLTGTGLDANDGCSTIPRFTTVIAYTLQLQDNVNIGVDDCDPSGENPTPEAYTYPAYIYPTSLPDPLKDAVLVE